MKKIGLVDYFIDEWHSNTYLSLFVRAAKALSLDYEVAYAWAEMDRFESRRSTDEWCKENGIERCETLEALCESADCMLILAPADPEKHLPYAKTVLRYGKPTYIDKTFAENSDAAKAIYALSEQYGAPIFSTSALRYVSELEDLIGAESLVTMGGGRSLEEYIVHQLEMAVKVMGTDISSVRLFDRGAHATAVLDFGGRIATLNYSQSAPFAVDAKRPGEAVSIYRPVEDGDYFYRLIESILVFFETGAPPFKKEETLAVIAARDAILRARSEATSEPVAVLL